MVRDNNALFLEELFSHLRKKPHTKKQLTNLKMSLSKKYTLRHIPQDYELLIVAPDDPAIRRQLKMKPVRTRSGVAVVALMTEPRSCPHGKCTMCPGGPDSVFGSVPQSYTGTEPASMRAARNSYDAYLQVFNRLEQYLLLGHEPGKVEMIVMGGTFPSYPEDYQQQFVSSALAAMNDFSSQFYPGGKLDRPKFKKFLELPRSPQDEAQLNRVHAKILSLREHLPVNPEEQMLAEQERNEKARIRCVALCVETRPDWAHKQHIDQMLSLGTTRVELGVQCLNDAILRRVKRGHTVKDSIDATALLKDSFLKVGYHMMPGLPGSSSEQDVEMFRELFENPDFRSDALKIYPCLVMPGTLLAKQFQKGKYIPLSPDKAARIVMNAKQFIPEYCRVMRIQRDIPSTQPLAGPNMTNLRQEVHRLLKMEKKECRCLRCREPGARKVDIDSTEMKRLDYESSGGTEVFLSIESGEVVLGYCRLRMPGNAVRPEITGRTAGIRELHVFGTSTPLGEEGKVQHRGLGSMLLAEAERIAAEELDAQHMLVISGIGVREYYFKKGYGREGHYVGKMLK